MKFSKPIPQPPHTSAGPPVDQWPDGSNDIHLPWILHSLSHTDFDGTQNGMAETHVLHEEWFASLTSCQKMACD